MDDDDDFGDFGGFEGADPNEHGAPPPNVEAGASPWAVFPPAVPQSQPDLLCAQNTFPPYLDPSGISGGSTNNNNDQHHLDLDLSNYQRPLDDSERRINDNGVIDPARQAENVLDGTVGAGVPGLDLAAGHPRADNPADICLNTDQARDNSRVLPDLGVGEGASLPDLGVGVGSSLLGAGTNRTDRVLELPPSIDTLNQPLESVLNNDGDIVNSVSVDEERSSAAGSEVNGEIQEESNSEELVSLRTLNAKLEEDLVKCEAELDIQNQRLSQIESHHSTELLNLRQAGHDTLSVVVEQYKETTRTAILEQQESCTRYLQEKMKELTEAFHQSFETLNTEFNRKQDTQTEAEKERLTLAVTTARQEQQERFDEFLAIKREKYREELQKSLTDERESSQVKLDSAIQASQDASVTQMAEEQEKFRKRLQEQEKDSKANMQAALQEEQKKMEEHFKESIIQEQERSQVAMETVVREARQDSQDFINEQSQIDSRVRRRHLASLDLFLASARQQIQLLQDSEAPHSSTSPGVDTDQDKKS